MKNTQKGFTLPLLLALIAILLVGGGIYVYENKKVEIPVTPTGTTAQTTNQVQQTGKTSQQANGRGSGGIDIPTVNDFPASDFNISSPSNGETWSKGDSSKNISWIYPAELKGHNVRLTVYLVNLDLMKKGRSSGDPDVSLSIYSGSTDVPNSGKGGVAWDLLRATPETPFYGYSGNSRVLISVNDSNSLKVYNAVSDPFVVSPTTITSAPIVPIVITSPQTNATYKIGDTLDVKWTGSTHASDICDISLVGPLDQNGEVIQTLGAIIPIGGLLCSSGAFSWKINNSYLHGGYNYNMIIRSPYGSYTKTIMITQASSLGAVPVISSVSASSVSQADYYFSITASNLDPLGGYVGNGWISNSHVFVWLTNSSGQKGILWEGGSQGGNAVSGNQITMLIVPYTICTGSVVGMGGCPSDKVMTINPGNYSLTVSVDGRGTSDSVPLIVTPHRPNPGSGGM